MIKLRRGPCARRVAGFASLWETLLHVIRIRRALVILQVARHARGLRQVVVVVDVTIHAGARRDGMLPGQREASLRVIKLRRRPGTRCVTGFASLREALLDVVRVRRALVVLQVAGHASRLRQVVVVVDMAIRTLTRGNGVLACQRES